MPYTVQKVNTGLRSIELVPQTQSFMECGIPLGLFRSTGGTSINHLNVPLQYTHFSFLWEKNFTLSVWYVLQLTLSCANNCAMFLSITLCLPVREKFYARHFGPPFWNQAFTIHVLCPTWGQSICICMFGERLKFKNYFFSFTTIQIQYKHNTNTIFSITYNYNSNTLNLIEKI